MTNDPAASDVVVTSEIIRLRMKERENQAILPPDIISRRARTVPRNAESRRSMTVEGRVLN
jgi:hypothetical protein